jgi:MarR family 2-MHQ and catechol resistance regulon transcriptional repressor
MQKIFEEDRNSQHARTFYRLVEMSNKIELKIKQALKPFGLTHAQLNILYILASRHPRKLNPADIRDQVIVSNPDITRMIDRMVAKNWVERQTCPENRRKVDLSISDEGIETFKKAHYATKELLGDFFSNDIDENEARQLRGILKKIKI